MPAPTDGNSGLFGHPLIDGIAQVVGEKFEQGPFTSYDISQAVGANDDDGRALVRAVVRLLLAPLLDRHEATAVIEVVKGRRVTVFRSIEHAGTLLSRTPQRSVQAAPAPVVPTNPSLDEPDEPGADDSEMLSAWQRGINWSTLGTAGISDA
jgi:hypothetical protein